MRPIYTIDMRLTYAEYTADNGQKLILRLLLYYIIAAFCIVTKISVFGRISGVCQPYVSRMSAVCLPYISRISAVYQPSVSRISAVCQPYIRGMSAICQPWNGRMSAVYQPYISRMSTVCQPYIRRMSAIPNLPICRPKVGQRRFLYDCINNITYCSSKMMETIIEMITKIMCP